MACRPSAQAPRSRIRQREQQNGNATGRRSGAISTGVPQVGQGSESVWPAMDQYGEAASNMVQGGAAGMKGFPSPSCRLSSPLRMHLHRQLAHAQVALSVVLAMTLSVITATAADLETRIGQLLDGVPRGGDAGVAVYDLGVNAWLSRHDADKPLSLASTTKALVGAAALSQLGQGFVFRTQVWSIGALGPRF